LNQIAKKKAQSIDEVRARVLELIKGKKVVGYHLPQKLADFGILNRISSTQKSAETSPEKSEAKKTDSDSDSPKTAPNQI
jgi:hypothetical protein